jgi:predicted lipoprotein with Yx(FWY)xxD motif
MARWTTIPHRQSHPSTATAPQLRDMNALGRRTVLKGNQMRLVERIRHMARTRGTRTVRGRHLSSVGRRGGVVCLLAAGSLGLGALSAGAASGGIPHSGKAAVVVKISASRGGFKKVLTTDAGRTLYTAASCTGGCLSSWPPLFMPKGKTTPQGPKGLTGLGTVKVGSHLQVTYKKHRLYTFTGDTGSSVNGNGVAGFTVIANV